MNNASSRETRRDEGNELSSTHWSHASPGDNTNNGNANGISIVLTLILVFILLLLLFVFWGFFCA